MVSYGLTVINQNATYLKAKSKKDGCYTWRGFSYRVRDGRVTHFAVNGEVLEPCGNFNVIVGKYSPAYTADGLKKLKQI